MMLPANTNSRTFFVPIRSHIHPQNGAVIAISVEAMNEEVPVHPVASINVSLSSLLMKRGMKLPIKLKATDTRNWISRAAVTVSIRVSVLMGCLASISNSLHLLEVFLRAGFSDEW